MPTGIAFRTAQSFTDIIVPNYETVFASGGQGLMIRGSQANGKWEWAKLDVATEVNLNALTYANGSLWVVGDGGLVLESKDKGRTWTHTVLTDENGKARNLHRIRFVEDSGLTVGDGVVFSSAP